MDSTLDKDVSYNYIQPSHYKIGGGDVWDAAEKVFGKEKLITHLEISAFEYRLRAGKKPDQPYERDMEKALKCEEKINELKLKQHGG